VIAKTLPAQLLINFDVNYKSRRGKVPRTFLEPCAVRYKLEGTTKGSSGSELSKI
jgi:hypothetical protein